MSRPLQLFLGDDNLIWAFDKILGVAYRMPPSDQRNQHPPAPPPAAGVEEAPVDGQLYARDDAGWKALPDTGSWVACTYPLGCSGTLHARSIGDPAIATIELIGQASSVSTWDGSYNFILAHMPLSLVPKSDRFVLVPSSNNPGAPDSISCVWFKTTGEMAISEIYGRGPNPLMAWFDGIVIQK